MKILLSGCNGRMGEAITRRLPSGHEIVAGVSRSGDVNHYPYPVYKTFTDVVESFDVIVDFSVAENADAVIKYTKSVCKPLVMGTTGLSEEQVESLGLLGASVPVLFSHNTSFGVTVLLSLLEKASSLLMDGYDIELVEKHDCNKLDAPSGTSHLIVEALEVGAQKKFDVVHGRTPTSGVRNKNELGIHSIRGGNLASEHYISFIGLDETIEINHKAQSFDIYGIGAIKGAGVLLDKKPGIYSMKDILNISV
jgi:4-hydroxy-tetrahydrodipicolinate reductase